MPVKRIPKYVTSEVVQVRFDREPDDDLDIARTNFSQLFKRNALKALEEQLCYELDANKELKGTYKLIRSKTGKNGDTFVVEFTLKDFAGHHGHQSACKLIQTQLQYGYDRYFWAGSFTVLGMK